MQEIHSKWASRFIWAAVVQGLVAVVATVLIVEPLTDFNINWYFSPAKVIASGGGGTWMFTGYICFLVVGVIGCAVTALFYFYIEGVKGKVYKGFANILAWGHYILMNVGVTASMALMMYGGYLAGWSGSPVAEGGLGYTDLQIHINYLSHYVNPIGGFIVIACIGALLGGLGYIVGSRAK